MLYYGKLVAVSKASMNALLVLYPGSYKPITSGYRRPQGVCCCVHVTIFCLHCESIQNTLFVQNGIGAMHTNKPCKIDLVISKNFNNLDNTQSHYNNYYSNIRKKILRKTLSIISYYSCTRIVSVCILLYYSH